MKPFRIFVTGTDTGVGKTESAAALLSLLADAGMRPAPMKPYESGVAHPERPGDALTLRSAARSDDDLSLISVHRFRAPLAPGVAARREGVRPSFTQTMRAFESFRERSLVVEGAGGLLVPLDERRDVVDLIEQLKLPVLLVARAGLGTLNHTGLSLELLKARGIPVAAVLLVRSGAKRDASERDNPAELARRHRVRVLGPVPFARDAEKRRALFRRSLRPLL